MTSDNSHRTGHDGARGDDRDRSGPDGRERLDQAAELARRLRVDSVRAAAAAGSGHPTSAMSAAELMAVLLAGGHLRRDFTDPAHPRNDHLVLSKGHASPLLYAAYKAAGALDDAELLTFRQLGSRLEGHPTPRLPGVDTASGSLGQGLPIGTGLALAARLDGSPARVWVLCGDGELAEGSVWEAFEHAGHEGLSHLTAILDVNRLGQRGATRHGWDLAAYARRIRAFGWHTVEVDGHDPAAVDDAYAQAVRSIDRPTAVIARTEKGHGVKAVADRLGAHGKPLPDEAEALAELGEPDPSRAGTQPPLPLPGLTPRPAFAPGSESGPTATASATDTATDAPPAGVAARAPAAAPSWPRTADGGDPVATRDGFGAALAALGDVREDLVVLDGEVADSTRAQEFADRHPERFVQCYIAEQQLVSAAVGFAARGRVPVAVTFAAFLSRAHDFLRMAAVTGAGMCAVGTHAGVAIGQDGPSQMGLEDLAMFRALPGSTVLHPCDANQAAALTAAIADAPTGIRYLRVGRGADPVLYASGEEFPIGGSRLLAGGDDAADTVTLAAAGATVHEALRAAELLRERHGVSARVLDLYSVKPLDAEAVRAAGRATGRIVTVEDHRPEGGLGDAVAEAFDGVQGPPVLVRLAVRNVPGSATPEEQLREAGIDAEAIVAAAVR